MLGPIEFPADYLPQKSKGRYYQISLYDPLITLPLTFSVSCHKTRELCELKRIEKTKIKGIQ